MPCRRCRFSPFAGAPIRRCGMNTSTVTTTSATSPCPAHSCATSSTPTQKILALLGFGASAWQSAPRDQFIGWTHAQRQRNLHLIVNNARFLILPWVTSKNLASKILALAARRLPEDWQRRYGYRPVLMETFVEKNRFSGTCYQAANWTCVDQTQGRGKLGPSGKQRVPVKDLWLYPLDRHFRSSLTR